MQGYKEISIIKYECGRDVHGWMCDNTKKHKMRKDFYAKLGVTPVEEQTREN